MAAFVISAFVLAMLPGPATALLIRETVSGNRRRVIGVLGGMEVGIFAWAVLSGLGVAALVAASALAYTILRAVGAAVLVVLGVQTLWYTRSRRPDRPKPRVDLVREPPDPETLLGGAHHRILVPGACLPVRPGQRAQWGTPAAARVHPDQAHVGE